MRKLPAAILITLLLVGCGADRKSEYRTAARSEKGAASAGEAGEKVKELGVAIHTQHNAKPAQESTRKLIYTGTVDLVVDDLRAFEQAFAPLLKAHHGEVSESTRNRTYGEQLSGRWIVRVPVTDFEAFLDGVSTLGVPESRHINGQDVSEEYVDLEARLTNSRRLEERMLKLLEDKTGDLKDVIAVEAELSRVRESIEQMEGRLRFLNDRIALTTLTINVREEKDYVPPEAPTLGQQIAATFGNSLQLLKNAGVNCLLAATAVVPWLPLAIVLVPVWRWKQRRAKLN